MFWKRKPKSKKVAVVPVTVIFALMQELVDIDALGLNLKVWYNGSGF
jgi:hypothetical protein